MAARSSAPLRLTTMRDVAHISTVMRPTALHRVGGEPAILVEVFLRSGASDAEVATCFERILSAKRPPSVKRVVPISAR